MFHDETRSYRESDEVSACNEDIRADAAAVLLSEIAIYHEGKRLVRRHGITMDNYAEIPAYQRRRIDAARNSSGWLRGDLTKKGRGLTFEACCDILHFNPEVALPFFLSPKTGAIADKNRKQLFETGILAAIYGKACGA